MKENQKLSPQEISPWIKNHLPRRTGISHKFTNGYLTAIVGSKDYPGAARLSTHAAARVGAGGVQALIPESLWLLLGSFQPEIMPVLLREKNGDLDPMAAFDTFKAVSLRSKAILIGCGMGRAASLLEFVRSVLTQTSLPVVLDGDALYVLGQLGKEFTCAHAQGRWILTPHAGEWDKLMDAFGYFTPRNNQGINRYVLTQQIAQELNLVIVAKGFPTVIYAPTGEVFENAMAGAVSTAAVSTGAVSTAAASTAGCGDVLAGAIAGYLAQGLVPIEAARMGFYQAERAAQNVLKRTNYYSLMASDIIGELGQGD